MASHNEAMADVAEWLWLDLQGQRTLRAGLTRIGVGMRRGTSKRLLSPGDPGLDLT